MSRPPLMVLGVVAALPMTGLTIHYLVSALTERMLKP